MVSVLRRYVCMVNIATNIDLLAQLSYSNKLGKDTIFNLCATLVSILLMLVRLSFSTLVFWAILTTLNSETNDISFESPNIELLESEIKIWHHQGDFHIHLSVTIFQGRLIFKELQYILCDT